MADNMVATGEAEECPVSDRAVAERYVAKVCFKTGPPRRLGVELEWTVHRRTDPTLPIDPAALAAALGDHTPRTLRPDSPQAALPRGGVVTVEPGGQVEISGPPHDSLSELLAATSADIDRLTALLHAAGLALGDQGCDAYRQVRRVVDTPRYAAMERAFDRLGPSGRTMMCSTASVQVCLDAGEPDRVGARWNALHTLGPVLVAAFANSQRAAGRDTGWASGRMHAWFGTDPTRTHPSPPDPDPVGAWARRVLDTPLLCLRRQSGAWEAPAGVTFADWIDGALPTPPTYGDLDYHLTTLFPPVRARGYLEVRYLDAQRGDDWFVPVAVLAALFAREETVDAAAEAASRGAGRWVQAARAGLADPVLAQVAPAVLDLACQALADTDLPPSTTAAVTRAIRRRLHRGGTR
jgi:glutamate--cysteine ligase